MKIASLILLLLVVVCVELGYLGWYSLGWTGSFWPGLDPFSLGFKFLLFSLAFLLLSVVMLFSPGKRSWAASLLVIWAVYLSAHWFLLPRPGAATIYGFRDRVMKVSTLDDLRHLARVVEHNDIAPFRDEPQDVAGPNWQQNRALQKRYPYMTWGKDHLGKPYVGDDLETEKVFWGGALNGRWGFSIRLDGKRNELDPQYTQFIRVSDDIYFFSADRPSENRAE